MSKFLFEYYHEDAWWIIVIDARSAEDALARSKKIPNARFLGIVKAQIPAKLGFLARLICLWKNMRPETGEGK